MAYPQYRRLPLGVASVSMRTMENIVQGIPQMGVYLDDILIGEKT